jgi:hypothetical protein
MPAFNAIGVNAIGTATGNSAASAALSCIATASSTVTTNLTTAIRLGATVAASAAITASLAAGGARFIANPASTSTASANLATQILMQANASSYPVLSANLATQILMQAGLHLTAAVNADLTPGQAAPNFTPSAARTIFVMASSPVFTGSKWWNLTDTKKPRGLKDPNATIDITFDWSDWLNDIGPAIISDVTFTVVGTDTAQVFHDNTTATIFLSGGVNGNPSTVACKIQTNTTPSRTDERTVYIDIADE